MCLPDNCIEFRFHTGSIKSDQLMMQSELPIQSFDSILVRLKVSEANRLGLVFELFRFHTGSIKRDYETIAFTKYPKFRFHTGSIKSRHLSFIPIRSVGVSIPYWFD